MGPYPHAAPSLRPVEHRRPDEAWYVAKRAQIEREIAGLRDGTLKDDAGWGMDWAGEYYYGDGLSTSTTVRIAPRGGLVLENHGCLGSTSADEADVQTLAPNHVRISFKHSQEWGVDGSGNADYHFIRWGDRRYLISRTNVPGFCNAYNHDRLAPRQHRQMWEAPLAWLPVRIEDADKPGGRPVVPAEFASLIPDRPIACRLLDHAQLAIVNAGKDGKERAAIGRARIDAGAVGGVVPGMELVADVSVEYGLGWDALSMLNGRIVVESVEAHTALVQFEQLRLSSGVRNVPPGQWTLHVTPPHTRPEAEAPIPPK